MARQNGTRDKRTQGGAGEAPRESAWQNKPACHENCRNRDGTGPAGPVARGRPRSRIRVWRAPAASPEPGPDPQVFMRADDRQVAGQCRDRIDLQRALRRLRRQSLTGAGYDPQRHRALVRLSRGP